MQKIKKDVVSNSIVFAIGYFKSPLGVGTIFQSSNFLAKRVAREVIGKNIVEFGSGTGIITKEILKKLSEDGRLTCFEIIPDYCIYLKKKFSKEINSGKLKVIEDSAGNYKKYLKKIPDSIVSGLPLASLDKTLVHSVLMEAKKTKKYIQYQYSPFSKPILKKYFKKIRIKRELLNYFPATIYICNN
jgi:phospholipid N-methyltransferase